MLLTTLPVAIAVCIAVALASAQIERLEFDRLSSIAQTKAEAIRRELQDDQAYLRAIFADNFNRTNAITLLRAPENAANAMRSTVTNYLEALLQAQNNFTEYFLYDTDGRIVASTQAHHVGMIVRRQPYFSSSLTDERVHPPFPNELRHQSFFAVRAVGEGAHDAEARRPLSSAVHSRTASGRLSVWLPDA